MKKTSFFVLYIVLLFACKSTDSKENTLNPNDTLKIISAVQNGSNAFPSGGVEKIEIWTFN